MNPADFDGDDGDGLSFNELPPSVRARVQASTAAPQPQYAPQVAQTAPQPRQGPPQYAPPQYAGQPQMGAGLIPIGQAGQGEIYTPAATASTGGDSANNTPWLFIGATVLLGAVGWWAYSRMEKDKKIRVGPPQLGRGKYRDDARDGDYDGPGGYDDEESGGPLDAYEDVGLDPKEVDPHEKGGIKLVKG